jgi:glycosyltransferase involved in cell wall biosynthesis
MRKKVCILSFSPISQDARVLRQVQYLSPAYDLLVIGYGLPHPDWKYRPGVVWRQVPNRAYFLLFSLLIKALYVLGRVFPFSYEVGYWIQPEHREAYRYAIEEQCDLYFANDLEALPVAARAALKYTSKLAFDAHEYAPLEFEERKNWWVIRGQVEYFLLKYSAQIDLSITVVQQIADRYWQEFAFKPIVVMNAPPGPAIPPHPLDPQHIRLVHHGAAIAERRLDTMIESIALCDARYSLHFMLMPNQPGYLLHLKELAEKLAPGRVHFHDPVKPDQIVNKITTFEIGLFPLKPTNYNYQVALPNKFFDFIMAGLAIVIGPSPAMAEIVKKYGCGRVAPSFEPVDIAQALNQLSQGDIAKMRQAANRAALELNADHEMAKLVAEFDRITS